MGKTYRRTPDYKYNDGKPVKINHKNKKHYGRKREKNQSNTF